MNRIFKFLLKKHFIYIGLGIIMIAVIIIWLKKGNGKQLAIVKKMDVIQEVAATGKIKPEQSVNLGFDKSGRVEKVYVQIGDKVKSGQIMVTLESAETAADLTKARASLEEENIKLRVIKNTAPVFYSDAYKNLEATIKNGFTNADNAVRNRADQFFKNVTVSPQFEISITSGNFVHYFNVPPNLALEINNKRKEVENILTNWQKRTLNINSTNMVNEANSAIDDLNNISIFFDKMASAVNAFISADYAYNATVVSYKTAISSSRSEVLEAISAIVSAKDKLNSAPALGQGGEFENILTQEAKVKQTEAAVSSLEASFNKLAITASFDGIITLQDAKVGSAVSAKETLVSMISQNKMYIEANISEIHIGKIMTGNPVFITFDAFPAENFLGQVSYIEPGDTIIEGVVNYKIRVNLANADPRIKSGLTTNLKIQTSKKNGILAIPLYAVLKEDNQNFVNKVNGKEIQKIPVTLGLIGDNGSAEILSGLEDGDTIEF